MATMVFKLTLIASLLLASAALADPSSRLKARLARRRESRQSVRNDHVDLVASDTTPEVVYVANWAGAVVKESNGTFTSITGTFAVVTPFGADGSAASAWVGIGGDDCSNSLLQTGVDFDIGNDGSVSYAAWYEWYPTSPSYYFTGITINSGDIIQATVTALSATSGFAVIENLTNGQTVSQNIDTSMALCGANAQWIMEDFQVGGQNVQLANFGTVTFSDASASGPGGTYTPADAVLVDMTQNNQILTSVSVTDSSVSVTYIL